MVGKLNLTAGQTLQQRLNNRKILPLIGIYDVFSGAIAARHFDAVFCSGYGLSASHYALPDEGFIGWTDVVSWVERLRYVLPETHIFVDIDDGFGCEKAATNVVMRLEHVGASAVILEDQKRPKKCGHLDGKEIVPLPEYLKKLEAVLAVRDSIQIVARTDATDFHEGIKRAKAFTRAGADIVLVEGVKEVDRIPELRSQLGDKVKILVNVIAGGKTPPITLSELSRMGVDVVNYSTPCLFSAHKAIDQTMRQLRQADGELEAEPVIGLNDNALFLAESMDIAQGRLKPVVEEEHEVLQAV